MWRTARSGELRENGAVALPGLLPLAACERLTKWCDLVLESDETFIGPDTWLVRRINDFKGKDTQVRQIMNAHLVNPDLAAMARERLFENLLEDALGWPIRLESLTLQVDDPDVETKRGWHVDRFTPPTFKAFVYLSDVDEAINGPYTVIPGSHRHVLRKIVNLVGNAATGAPRTDLRLCYNKSEPRLFTGPAGTGVLSVQTIAHRGWPGHAERRRYMIVAYMSLAKSRHEEFRLGRAQAEREASASKPEDPEI